MDGILTVYFGGLAFKMTQTTEKKAEEQLFQTSADLFFTLAVFFLLGLVLPWSSWIALGWKGIFLVVGILLLRRLLVVFLLQKFLKPEITGWQEAAFAGWFGPIGISALFYVAYSLRETDLAILWPVVTLVIFSSIIAYGITAIRFTNLLGRVEKRSNK